jgi:hypothetical protein
MKIILLKILLFIITIANLIQTSAQNETGFQIARLKYSGGGDWYNDPSAEVNLLKFVQANTNIKVNAEYKFVDIASDEIFSYPFLFLTGHGNIVLSTDETKRLKTYLENGGFLYIDDDYGMDKAIRREMKKVFPGNDFIEVPFSHKIFNIFYKFENGIPKTHEHDKNPPQTFGIFLGTRLVVLYTFESNPSDGWADPEVHNDPKDKREEALKFGTNIIIYALSK